MSSLRAKLMCNYLFFLDTSEGSFCNWMGPNPKGWTVSQT